MVDAATLSAVAASAAAVAAGTVAGIQLYVGHRESKASLISANAAMMDAECAGRHTVAAFRQKWIEAVRDTLSEYHSILMSASSFTTISEEERRALIALKMKLSLMLNPEEEDSKNLLLLLAEMRNCESWDDRADLSTKISMTAQKILKTEWVRIKEELKERNPGGNDIAH